MSGSNIARWACMARNLGSLLCFFLLPSIALATAKEQLYAQFNQQLAVINYSIKDPAAQQQAIAQLQKQVDEMRREYPDAEGPVVWQAVLLATEADIEDNISAIGKAKHARDLLLAAEGRPQDVPEDIIDTALGSLYYNVPGWPVGFGDKDTARKYLKRALALNPGSIDAHFYYGDYLSEQGEYKEARQVLTVGLKLPTRPAYALADNGRMGDIRELLEKIKDK